MHFFVRSLSFVFSVNNVTSNYGAAIGCGFGKFSKFLLREFVYMHVYMTNGFIIGRNCHVLDLRSMKLRLIIVLSFCYSYLI